MGIKLAAEIKLSPKLKTLFKIILIALALFLAWLIIDIVVLTA